MSRLYLVSEGRDGLPKVGLQRFYHHRGSKSNCFVVAADVDTVAVVATIIAVVVATTAIAVSSQ